MNTHAAAHGPTPAARPGTRRPLRALDALLVLLLAVPFYYYMRANVQSGLRVGADSFRYLWTDVPLNISYFFNSSFSVRALFSLADSAKNILKLNEVMLGVAQIALYLSLRRGGAFQRVLLAGALALFFGSEEAHWYMHHAMSDPLHLSFWLLFVCALAAYRGPAANLVVVLSGALFAFSRNVAAMLTLGMVLFYLLLNLRDWRRLRILPALLILGALSIGVIGMTRHLNPAVEYPVVLRFHQPGAVDDMRYLHDRHGMPFGPFVAACSGASQFQGCLDSDVLLHGNTQNREYEAKRDDYGLIDWLRAGGNAAWQRYRFLDPQLYQVFLQHISGSLVGTFDPAYKRKVYGEGKPPGFIRKETDPFAADGTYAIPVLAWLWQRLGLVNPWALLLLIAGGTALYWTRWRDRALALPLLLMASAYAGGFLNYAGVAAAERHFWPIRICLYLGIVFLLWAFAEVLVHAVRARRQGAGAAGDRPDATPAEATPAQEHPGPPAPLWPALGLIGLVAIVLYLARGSLAQAPLPLPAGTQTAVFGMPAHEATAAAALLPDGDVVVVGRVLGPGRGAAAHVHGTASDSGYDAFVARISADLDRPAVYAVIGGGDDDHATDVVVGPTGDIYVSGFTRSADFPGVRPGAVTAQAAAQADGFVVRLSSDLSKITAGIRLGGSDHDLVRKLALDGAGRVYAAGDTASRDFGVAPGAAQPERDSFVRGRSLPPVQYEYGTDGFVARLDRELRGIEAATYLGGPGDELLYDLVVGGHGDIYVVGSTTSDSLAGLKPKSSNEGAELPKAFVAGLNADLSAIRAVAMLDGNRPTFARSATLDAGGRLLVAGNTYANDLPTSVGAFQPRPPLRHAGSGWIAAFEPASLEMTAATYLGGLNTTYIFDIAADRAGRIVVTGETKSVADFPGIDPGVDRFFDRGREDVFVSYLSPDLSRLHATVLAGGGGRDRAHAVLPAGDGSLIVAGDTGTADFPVTRPRRSAPPDDVRHQIAVVKLPPPPK